MNTKRNKHLWEDNGFHPKAGRACSASKVGLPQHYSSRICLDRPAAAMASVLMQSWPITGPRPDPPPTQEAALSLVERPTAHHTIPQEKLEFHLTYLALPTHLLLVGTPRDRAYKKIIFPHTVQCS
ncbi:hypothetical protein AVEN_196801-1 [Araneus ventricosus]|uniref:Uncharacterized protein n=1 Tax=Araneus ventricosus TaxID=182803 RepID=A0A4Y2WSY6_ARAVE|nr:hypothetical protein AVEN_196801-1 [Araneus ventricosus]